MSHHVSLGIFHKGVHAILLFLLLVHVSGRLIAISYAQSGIGVGIVSSRPHSGGLSVRYKAIQVLVGRIGNNADNGFNIEVAARYNHSFRKWKRGSFRLFGQIGQQRDEQGTLERSYRYRLTIGASPDFRIVGWSSSKGLYLTADVGFSIDHTG